MNYTGYPLQERLNNFLYGVYGWMAGALALTAITAYYVSGTPQITNYIFNSPGALIFLFLAQIALVIILSLFIFRMSLFVAIGVFLLYAISLGVTLSSIFLVYTQASIYLTFVVTAGMFGAMCLYGYFTKSDLSSIGNMSFMLLIGLILAMVINIFLKSSMLDLIISGVGVIIFTLLTAYDTQKLKRIGEQLIGQNEIMSKVMILGALTLYLDFINLFLFMLRFMGRRQE